MEIKPFSETISTGTDPVVLMDPIPDFYAGSDITISDLQRGKDLNEKVKIYLSQASTAKNSRQDWLEFKLQSLWKKKEKHLPSSESIEYNKALLNFLTFHDNDYCLGKILEGKEPIPKELQKYLKAQIDELVKKPVKARGKEEIALSRREQEKIYAIPGVVPTWWWYKPEKGTYTYHAMKAIKGLKVSARDVKLAVQKAADGNRLNPFEIQIIARGWGILSKEGRKIIGGKFPVDEKMFRQYGEYYHRDVGWY